MSAWEWDPYKPVQPDSSTCGIEVTADYQKRQDVDSEGTRRERNVLGNQLLASRNQLTCIYLWQSYFQILILC